MAKELGLWIRREGCPRANPKYYGGNGKARIADTAGRVSPHESQNYGGGGKTRIADTAGNVSTRESHNYGDDRKTRLVDKARRVSTRKSQILRRWWES